MQVDPGGQGLYLQLLFGPDGLTQPGHAGREGQGCVAVCCDALWITAVPLGGWASGRSRGGSDAQSREWLGQLEVQARVYVCSCPSTPSSTGHSSKAVT